MIKLIDKLAASLQNNIQRFGRIAESIRFTTTMNETASQRQMVAAGERIGLNASTVRIQFNKARAEDAEVEAACGDAQRPIIIAALAAEFGIDAQRAETTLDEATRMLEEDEENFGWADSHELASIHLNDLRNDGRI